jgi:S-adenosylmethionine decarboxylase
MTNIGTVNFGEHFTLDGYGGNSELLNDEKLVFNCLNELPTLMGMHKLSNPQVFSAPDNHIKDPGGWSGFVVIMESHISIHTFPKRGFVSADVYTCRDNLDTNFISEYFKKVFQLSDLETNFIKRGTRYPDRNIL